MILERTFQEWLVKRTHSGGQAHALVVDTARKNLGALDSVDLTWLSESLTDDQRKFFTAALFSETGTLPQELYEPMMRAAVYEPSPLQAHAFVEPCVKSFGVKRAHKTLMDFFGNGTNYEKTGAVNALHWCNERKVAGDTSKHHPDGELVKLQEIQQRAYMKTFLDNQDIELRRALITHMDLSMFAPTASMQELIDRVIKTCRNHTDQYIRNRVEVQLGRATSQYTLPARKRLTGIMVNTKKSWWKQLWK